MKRLAFINKLEESFQDIFEISYEDALSILSKTKVKEGFDKIFNGIKEISESDVDTFTDNRVLKSIIYLYARKNNIIITRNENVTISDLSEDLIEYGNKTRKLETYDQEKIEELLKIKNTNNINTVIESNLYHVYLEALRYSTDESIFEDLLSVGNEALIIAANTYDETKHDTFELYLSYLLNDAMSKKVSEKTFSDKNLLHNMDIIYSDFENDLLDKIATQEFVKVLLMNSNLTSKEKRIIELRFGLIDGINYDTESIAEELKLDKISTMSLEVSAIKKIKAKTLVKKDA